MNWYILIFVPVFLALILLMDYLWVNRVALSHRSLEAVREIWGGHVATKPPYRYTLNTTILDSPVTFTAYCHSGWTSTSIKEFYQLRRCSHLLAKISWSGWSLRVSSVASWIEKIWPPRIERDESFEEAYTVDGGFHQDARQRDVDRFLTPKVKRALLDIRLFSPTLYVDSDFIRITTGYPLRSEEDLNRLLEATKIILAELKNIS